MMKFGDPRHHNNMLLGVKAALASPRTPAHLKKHLANRLQSQEGSMKKMGRKQNLVDPLDQMNTDGGEDTLRAKPLPTASEPSAAVSGNQPAPVPPARINDSARKAGFGARLPMPRPKLRTGMKSMKYKRNPFYGE